MVATATVISNVIAETTSEAVMTSVSTKTRIRAKKKQYDNAMRINAGS
jgi:hypothetical protein